MVEALDKDGGGKPVRALDGEEVAQVAQEQHALALRLKVIVGGQEHVGGSGSFGPRAA